MTWTTLATITAGQDWQSTPVIDPDLGYVRLTFETAGVPVWLAQVDPDSTDIYDERRITATPHARILEFEAPPFFSDRALALRVPNFATPFDVQIEVSSMPISRGGATQVTVNTPTSSNVVASAVTASTTSVQLLAANANRKSASILNNGTGILYVELGATASTSAFTISLNNGDLYELPIAYTGNIAGIWSATGGNALVREFV
ncbi:hypothetical protein NIES2135_58070 [Leptolyngbya boryana NIES-2135]|jgi:hypothetical protein|uniref:Uncharacterized protein n=1 Tax=Leptolyngbya boryana NIES-2135 TaxID=1973484 RepID=A0A1Z4JQC0_LEPBY|nr:hypothetical protein [Leptolyngbya boryana]ULP29983.1 hypothetical protein MCP04_28815 [Leptolyngbya boryana IU 594]BAS54928.1 hypothetical protein LBWT_8280 [Leptolyngbya boryana IAM M-101]BAS61276.1 hypothetical protein LBDG_08280 [Leptolyngbya boryana dg5]BAY58932.1 hypothetical protein NIES2135_58070 [Leptolyngbya boryana NIES-2135]